VQISVRFAGMGGQGIIFAGIVLARAAALYEAHEGRGLYAIQTQSYGPAARGESSKCDVVIADEPSFYPFVDRPDYLLLMSQPASEKFIGQASPRTVVLLDEDSVEDRPDLKHFTVPAIRTAEAIGHRDSANMVMLGALVQMSGVVSKNSVLKAIAEVSPMGSAESNEKAFLEGIRIAKGLKALDRDPVETAFAPGGRESA